MATLAADVVDVPLSKLRELGYAMRDQVCGITYWGCKHCGHHNRHRIRYTSNRVLCQNPECRRWSEPIFAVVPVAELTSTP